MEELLNKLVEKGWKPRGIYTSIIGGYGLVRCEEYVGSPRNERKSYRELVSKESGLWQFVCENGMIKTKGKKIKISTEDFDGYKGFFILYGYEYWLAMSALCNEENLEKFLLDNIKIEGNEQL